MRVRISSGAEYHCARKLNDALQVLQWQELLATNAAQHFE